MTADQPQRPEPQDPTTETGRRVADVLSDEGYGGLADEVYRIEVEAASEAIADAHRLAAMADRPHCSWCAHSARPGLREALREAMRGIHARDGHDGFWEECPVDYCIIEGFDRGPLPAGPSLDAARLTDALIEAVLDRPFADPDDDAAKAARALQRVLR